MGKLGPGEIWQEALFSVVSLPSGLQLTCGAAYLASNAKRG